ncbi:MAG TPA: type III pantothenate kinase, partial [Burkholderiaceae bacterium]|nr:type III pantothenate kinase [Burkholderiaceae bacterium]
MLLLVDAGNTRVKWALADSPQTADMPGRWHASGTVLREQVVELGDAWRGARIARAIVSNVAGPTMRDCIERALLRALGTVPVPVEWFASVPALAGVRNAYRVPALLGCDRFASAIGAHALYPGTALIVATCGTATTIDALTADGVFLGGMILPGLGLMAASLARSTAQLPQVEERIVLPQPFADNTHDAIVSGCIAAQVGAIERAFAAHRQQHRAARCILSGGAAEIIAPYLSMPVERVDNLVLIGLHTAALKHTPC